MKQLTLIILLTSSFLLFSQEKKSILQNFDTTGMETSILVQNSPLFYLDDFQKNRNNSYDFYQVFKAISQGDLKHRLPVLSTLKEQSKQSYFSKVIPLSILHTTYETIKPTAFKNGNVSNDSNGYLIRTTNDLVFNTHHLTIASSLRVNSKGLTTKFKLASKNIFDTAITEISSVEIDFNNGAGFKKITLDKEFTIQYTTAGHKTLTFKITLKNKELITTKGVIEILHANDDLSKLYGRTPTNFTSSIIPDLSVYGVDSYAGEGEYEVFLSTEPNAVLDKPIFVVDGFDPSDNRKIVGYTDNDTGDYMPGIYDFFHFINSSDESTNLLDLIRAEGYDIVLLNFPVYTRAVDENVIDGGVDFIERNAMLLVDLINQVNSQKIGSAQNVVIGPSMGGLITQYALNFMENQSMNHDTRLWIAFDSPLNGANVPIGFQHQFNFLANGLNEFWFIGNQNVEALQPVVNGMMKSNAARQMLTDQLEAHITNSDGVTFNSSLKEPQKHPFNPVFFDRMHALTSSGFPENTRKISIINGSGLAHFYEDKNGNDILPGREVVDVDMDVTTGTEAFLNVKFNPYANSIIEVSNVYIDFAWYIPAFDVESDADSQSFIYTDGVDAAPGGLFDISAVTSEVGTTGIAGEFVTALQTDYFNFIPAVSAMAIEFSNDETDWFHIINTTNLASETPFDAWSIPDENENHVTLTQTNVDFAWNEIVLQDPATILNTAFVNDIDVINPLNNELTILTKTNVSTLNVIVYDVNGKLLYDEQFENPKRRIQIPLSLTTGVYFVKLQSFENSITKKVIRL